MQALTDEAAAMGAVELRLYVHQGNRRAAAFYAKAGFGATSYDILTRKITQRPAESPASLEGPTTQGLQR